MHPVWVHFHPLPYANRPLAHNVVRYDNFDKYIGSQAREKKIVHVDVSITFIQLSEQF